MYLYCLQCTSEQTEYINRDTAQTKETQHFEQISDMNTQKKKFKSPIRPLNTLLIDIEAQIAIVYTVCFR